MPTPSEVIETIKEVFEEFKEEGKSLSANDLLRVLTKRLPGWKPTKTELAMLEEEAMSRQKEAPKPQLTAIPPVLSQSLSQAVWQLPS